MKACRSGNPEISDSITAGSTSMSSAKFLPECVPSKWHSFVRSISTLPIALLTHSPAFGSIISGRARGCCHRATGVWQSRAGRACTRALGTPSGRSATLTLPDYVGVSPYTTTMTKLAHKLGLYSLSLPILRGVQCNYSGPILSCQVRSRFCLLRCFPFHGSPSI